MRISAENVLRGKVTEITEGAIEGLVKLDVSGQTITSMISTHAIHEMGLKVGMDAAAIIKAQDVMLTTEQRFVISARNQLAGTVVGIEKGAVNGLVSIEAGEILIISSTNWHMLQEFDIKPGTPVTAVIKASEVMIAVEA